MQGFGNMRNGTIQRMGLSLLLAVMLAGVVVWTAMASVPDIPPIQRPRADIIVIDGLKTFGPLERPGVIFYHDKHTETLAKEKKDCLTCHPMDQKRLSLKFKRTADVNKKAVMAIYHDQCINCHKENKFANKASGPVTCGECHVKDFEPVSDWKAIGLDKSLHYRHVKANEKKCELCHHVFNPKTKKLYYAKGQEEACLYCHKEKTEENRIADGPASHIACVGCHRQRLAEKKEAGPIECGGCHDPKQQAMIEKIADVPRLERNQPDAVLVEIVPKDKAAAMPPTTMPEVPFDHKAHERYTDNCRGCHHAGLQSCVSCHTLQGTAEGKQVKLAQAMHQPDSTRSCVGCHNQRQARPQCAGCHAAMPPTRSLTTLDTCNVCHMPAAAKQPLPTDEAGRKALAAELVAARNTVQEAIPADQIPETITLKKLSNQYESVKMPHRKIVLKLIAGVQNDQLAARFHVQPATLCQGCHHKSPATLKPPQCGSCHGHSSDALNPTRPGLMAAYHQNCLDCHEKMGIKKPVSRECTACHAKRN